MMFSGVKSTAFTTGNNWMVLYRSREHSVNAALRVDTTEETTTLP